MNAGGISLDMLTGAGAAQRRGRAAVEAAGRRADAHDPAVAQQTAARLVSEQFFAPLLAEARKFPLGRDLVRGGQTESAFGEMLDTRLADAIAQRSAGGLIDHVARRLMGTPRQASIAESVAHAPAQGTYA